MRVFALLFTVSKLASLVFFAAILGVLSAHTANAKTNGHPAVERQISVASTTAQRSSQVTVSIEMNAQGDEATASFTLSFDPTVLSNPVVAVGTGASGASVGVNTQLVFLGRLGIVFESASPVIASPPNRQIVTVRFNVASNAPFAPSSISFIQNPLPLLVSNLSGVLLPTSYQTGTVTVAPLETLVTIGGRVTTPSGQNLRNAVVSLIDSNGVRRSATTSSFGLYSFENVATGRAYTLTAASKRYRFSPRVETVGSSATNLNFVGLE